MSKSRGRGVSGRTHTQAQINNYAISIIQTTMHTRLT